MQMRENISRQSFVPLSLLFGKQKQEYTSDISNLAYTSRRDILINYISKYVLC